MEGAGGRPSMIPTETEFGADIKVGTMVPAEPSGSSKRTVSGGRTEA